MKIIFIIISLLSFVCFADDLNHSCMYTTKYDSLKYTIKITYCCQEGELDCDNVYYEGIRKKDKSNIKLKGKTINHYSSHRLLGYQFQHNDYYYIIRGHQLSIYKNKVLLQSEELEALKN